MNQDAVRERQHGTSSDALRDIVVIVRYFLRRGVPEPSRILLIESGSRHLTETVIPRIRSHFGDAVSIDLVTCFLKGPDALVGSSTRIYNVNHYPTSMRRLRLLGKLRAERHPVAAVVCSGERTLARWKWVLVAALPAKVLVINENADYFWLDRGHWPAIRQFVKHRAGLADAGIIRSLARIIAFPFTFLYLLLYATAVHFRRAIYRGFR